MQISVGETGFKLAGTMAKDQMYEICDQTIIFESICKSFLDQYYDKIMDAIVNGRNPHIICSDILKVCGSTEILITPFDDECTQSAMGHDLTVLSSLRR